MFDAIENSNTVVKSSMFPSSTIKRLKFQVSNYWNIATLRSYNECQISLKNEIHIFSFTIDSKIY